MTRKPVVLKEIPADETRISMLTDGTVSQVEILVRDGGDGPWRSFGLGTAKRRKSEARYRAVGINLALARAFQDAADKSAAECRAHGYEPFPAPKPVTKVVRRVDPAALQAALRTWLLGLDADAYDDDSDLSDDAAMVIKYYFAALREQASDDAANDALRDAAARAREIVVQVDTP